MQDKNGLRKELRKARREHVSSLPDAMRGLVFRRPPAPLLELIPRGATIGLYRAMPNEAPAASYADFFHEQGHAIALPRFADRNAGMEFALHTDPYGEFDLETGPFGLLQPGAEAVQIIPDVLFVPLLGFTALGERLGQGGGHYDKWLEQNPQTTTVGLAWDVQLCDKLPTEAHDRKLDAVVTPTRLYGPF